MGVLSNLPVNLNIVIYLRPKAMLLAAAGNATTGRR